MTIHTKGGKILTKGGKLACDCCGGDWYCYSVYGACVTDSGCTIQCEADCTTAGGTFRGVGSSCCQDLATQLAQRPKSIVLSFGGTEPQAYGHGCGATPDGITRDGTWDNSTSWTPLDVFGANTWPASITLIRDTASTDAFAYRSGDWNGGDALTSPSTATVSVRCAHIKQDGKIAWSLSAASLTSVSMRSCRGWTKPSGFNPAGAPGVGSCLEWSMTATPTGNSADGFTFASQVASVSPTFGLGVTDPMRPQPIFCNTNISTWKITGVAIS
jgi:hypothetical protein